MNRQQLEQTAWDVIVVGTGMGGATTGYALAKAGKKVLFLERGRSSLHESALRGFYVEEHFFRRDNSEVTNAEFFARAGRYSKEWTDVVRRETKFIPFMGSGTGGSSALYGAVMERFFPSDFEKWPIAYAQMAPYYEATERLYRVRGNGDPLRNGERTGYIGPHASRLSSAGKELHAFFTSKRLHPYIPPLACEDPADALSSCQGYLCADGCKNDSIKICLKPALEMYGAHLLDECEALRMEATDAEVTGVVCHWRGGEIVLHADTYILAAGALETPRILAQSASSFWPEGLANKSGLVGKNLMRHFVDLWLVFVDNPPESDFKEVALNDLYEDREAKLGSVQSFGNLPSARIIMKSILQDLWSSRLSFLTPLAWFLQRPIMFLMSLVLSRTVVLATILEDLPQEDNRIDLSSDNSTLRFHYAIQESEWRRIRLMRARMRSILKPYRYVLIREAQNSARMAHVCGTCRFGDDPKQGVLDRNNRAHGVRNLYVVDSSFFPSSGGTNPGLTIAANALRVADTMLSK